MKTKELVAGFREKYKVKKHKKASLSQEKTIFLPSFRDIILFLQTEYIWQVRI